MSVDLPAAPHDSRPGLLAVTVAALQSIGRLVETDWDAETFDVLPDTDGRSPTLGVVFQHSRAVVFYAVRDDPVPADRRPTVADLVLRANTELYTSALEFDTGNGILSVRAGVLVGDLPIAAPAGINTGTATADGTAPMLGREAYAELLRSALDEAETVAADHADLIAAALEGTADEAAPDGAAPDGALSEGGGR